MKTFRSILFAAIVMTSLANAIYALQRYYHYPVLQNDNMWHREASMFRARTVLGSLGKDHVEYLPGPGGNLAADIGDFFETQYLFVPTLLYRNSPQTPWVLVNFGKGKPAVPMPGMTIVEDFDNGLALFRRDR